MTQVALISQFTARWLDRKCVDDFGLSTLILMELAGRALAQATRRIQVEQSLPEQALVCCGRGNNAGDGFVAARHLVNAGLSVSVLMLASQAQFLPESDAGRNLRVLQKMGVPMLISEKPESLIRAVAAASSGVLVDALLGTGLQGKVRPPFRVLIEALNASASPVVSADLPSGLDGDTGEVRGACVDAEATVTFGFAKVGLARREGPSRSGTIEVADISLPWPLKQEVLRNHLEAP